MKKTRIMGLLVMGLIGASSAFASGNHQGMDAHHGAMHGGTDHGMSHGTDEGQMKEKMKDHMSGMFLVKRVIDGYSVSFHIMKAPEGVTEQGTHHLMVKVEKDGAPVEISAVNSKTVHPNGRSESKMMMKMGNWYMAGYNFDHQGRHQMMVLFKTTDGVKHFGGVYYPEKGKE